MLLKDLRELGLSVSTHAIVGKAEFQRSEVGSREDGARGVK